MSMLEECVNFDDDLLRRLENAIEKNSQVEDAWGVPDRIRKLVDNFKGDEQI